MSTIVARFNLDGRPVEKEALASMLHVQNHRGPGRKAVWAEGAVGLGHGALLLADHTPYPLQSEDGSIVLVADARIDNREELARLLDLTLLPDQDGPLILAAYRRWGVDCCKHLLGDFAFVLWDENERRLFGARDPFGVRSLFYHHAPAKHMVLSSEIKGFWCHPEIPKKLDEVRFAEAIQLIDTDAARTMYADIRSVPAAHAFVLRGDGLSFSRYWEPEVEDDWKAQSDEAYAEELRERFTTAVRRRMRGTQAVAAELSGGLDSSSIACAARDVRVAENGLPLDTLSLRYPEYPEADEGAYIEAVLARGHFKPHFQNGGGRSTLTDIARVFEIIDDPSLVAANHHHVWMRFELAKAANMDVVLTGFDGDTIIGHGFERYYELARAGQWETFRYEATRFEQRIAESSSGTGDQIYQTFPGALQKYGVGSLRLAAEEGAGGDFFRMLNGMHHAFSMPRGFYLKRFGRRLVTPRKLLRARRAAQFALSPLLRPEVSARTNLHARAVEVELNERWPMAIRDRQIRLIKSPFYLRTVEALDAYASAFSLEARHPFLDIDLLAFCTRLPAEQRLRDGWTRLVLRNAMKGILPDTVRLRPGKTNFGNTTTETMFELDRPRMQEMLEDPGPIAPYVNMAEVQKVVDKPLEEIGRDVIRLGHLVSLRRWMQKQSI